MKYDAFISYSHTADGQLVPMLRNGLQRFGTPWGPFRWTNPIRSLRIFQDVASLSADPALWSTIEQALTESEWFVLLASCESARSQWVDKEVELWCRDKPLNRLLIVQTGGVIAWDNAANDFDWLETDALPLRLRGIFREEPRWVDARFAHANAGKTKGADPRFHDLVAELAAPLRGVPKDDLIGEDIRQHRRLSLWRNVALIVLTTLLVVALAAAGIARQQRNLAEQRRTETERQLHVSEYRRLAAQATSADAFDLALLLAIEATRLDDNRETRRALLDVLHSQRHVHAFFFDRPESGPPSWSTTSRSAQTDGFWRPAETMGSCFGIRQHMGCWLGWKRVRQRTAFRRRRTTAGDDQWRDGLALGCEDAPSGSAADTDRHAQLLRRGVFVRRHDRRCCGLQRRRYPTVRHGLRRARQRRAPGTQEARREPRVRARRQAPRGRQRRSNDHAVGRRQPQGDGRITRWTYRYDPQPGIHTRRQDSGIRQ